MMLNMSSLIRSYIPHFISFSEILLVSQEKLNHMCSSTFEWFLYKLNSTEIYDTLVIKKIRYYFLLCDYFQ